MEDRYRVIYSDRSLADLGQIFDYIFEQSPQNAVLVLERILAAIDDLNSMPFRYRVVGQSRQIGSDIRAFAIASYVIAYRVDESPPTVWILSVRHGSRREPREAE